MDFFAQKHIHLIGIGGIGVSALARLFHAKGITVSGSDVCESDETRRLVEQEIAVHIGHDARIITPDTSALIYSSAVLEEDPERAQAHALNIPSFSYPEALGMLMEHHRGIAVSGTNGKTTTTALLGKMFEAGGMDPTVVVGGRVPGWDRNLRIGASEIFIAEGCEYRRNMLHLHPEAIVLTNIEEDHLDYYKDIHDIESAFTEYVQKLPAEGMLIYNHNDPRCRPAAESFSGKKISFGFAEGADVRIFAEGIKDGRQIFALSFGHEKQTFATPLPGRFNLSNIAAGAACAHAFGVDIAAIQKAVEVFSGTWRRFEYAGKHGDAIVISDYAHHPTAVKATIEGAKELYPDRRIIAAFQPHQKDRTIKLFDEFVDAFGTSGADRIILTEIYEVAGRNEASKKISSRDVADEVGRRYPATHPAYAATLAELQTLLAGYDTAEDLILVMGAGDIDKVARMLVRT